MGEITKSIYVMNTEKKKEAVEKSEKIASTVLRTLAIVGLVSVLALATWVLVRGIAYFPNARESMVGTVTSVTNIFQNADEESLTFDLLTRIFPVNEPASISWSYEGSRTPSPVFSFMYHCGTEVSLSIMNNGAWEELECGASFETEYESVLVTPHNKDDLSADLRITVETGTLVDSIIISFVNTEAPTKESTEKGATSETTGLASSTSAQSTSPSGTTPPAQKNEKDSQTQVNRTVHRTVVVPQYSGPTDLVVEILNTGVLVPVDGENVFFPISPIPSDKVAGVTFTVTNKGGVTSDIWRFKAQLPVEGDPTYAYLSPLQTPLTSGMQVQFTLGFDQLIQDKKGIIHLELLTDNDKDDPSNNTDSVSITISTK